MEIPPNQSYRTVTLETRRTFFPSLLSFSSAQKQGMISLSTHRRPKQHPPNIALSLKQVQVSPTGGRNEPEISTAPEGVLTWRLPDTIAVRR